MTEESKDKKLTTSELVESLQDINPETKKEVCPDMVKSSMGDFRIIPSVPQDSEGWDEWRD